MPRAIRESRAMREKRVGDSRWPDGKGFTLVELLVVVVIVMALAAITLAGMAGARKRAKIDRTRTTISKIHEIVMPQYESYLRRRVVASPNPSARLLAVRRLAVAEMPDSWGDVTNPVDVPNLPSFLRTGPVLGYSAAKSSASPGNGSAECLYLIASRGPGEPDAMERFRTDEVGDTDGDGAPEFLDAWGRPILFVRWASGFSSPASPVQFADPANYHDPFDPLRQDPQGFALVPLIVSVGPDGRPGLQGIDPPFVWSSVPLQSIVGINPTYGRPDGTGDATDNITNHDLSKK